MSISVLGNRDNAFGGDSVSGHTYGESRRETAEYNESTRKSGSRAILGAALSLSVVAFVGIVTVTIVSFSMKK